MSETAWPDEDALDEAEVIVDEHLFFRALGRYPLLTPKGEVELAKQIERGDKHARDRMIESNLRLVIFIARRYKGRGLPLPDLVQEGTIGLARAVNKFDWRRGWRFSTYAAWWIHQACQRALDDQARVIRIPIHVLSRQRQVLRVAADLETSLGRAPTVEEIANLTSFGTEQVLEALNPPAVDSSLDRPLGEASQDSPLDLIEDERFDLVETVLEQNRANSIRRSVESLPERERKVVHLRYGLSDNVSKTHREIGDEFGTDQDTVSRIERKALERLLRMSWTDPWLTTE